MSALTYTIEERDSKRVLIWNNGASRPAGEIEVALWDRVRDLERKLSDMQTRLPAKALRDLALIMDKVSDLKIVVPGKKVYEKAASNAGMSSAERQKKIEEYKAKAAARRNGAANFGKREALNGPTGRLPG